MSLETNGFEFDEFLLDTKEKVLLRQGKPVPITPKTFQLLLALVENHGRLVEKDKLMSTVWADSFVEDGNLAFTIRLLRKALGDEKRKPRFIETVPRRGYRFIAKVRTAAKENGSNNGSTAAQSIEETSAEAPSFKKLTYPFIALLIAGVILIGFWLVRSKNSVTSSILSTPFSSEKLSTNGKVFNAVISPDGKNFVYTNLGGSKASVWVRQLESGNNVEIIPPSEIVYGALAFSPDGNFLYFTRRPVGSEEQFEIYRLPISGGVLTKVIGETQGWLSVSPDGARISFARCPRRDDDFCSLWIADAADGKNEKKLVSRPRPIRIGDSRFSPDGRLVAFAVGQSENAANEFSLSEVDIESGTERELTAEKFFNIKSLAWLPDKSGILLTARKNTERNFRIWQVSLATGEVEPLTKDSEIYSILSLDREASRLVSTQIKPDFRLRLWNMDNPSGGQDLAGAYSARFAPNGKIIFSSTMSDTAEIWSINADGSGQRQLTNDTADDSRPITSPDNNLIFFVSNRTGEAHVWRMNADGSNPVQITQKDGGFPISVSPDGRWVYYQHGINRTLWRALAAGGEEQMVLNKAKNHFSLSPDGSQVAFSERQGEERILTIVSLTDGQTVKTFRLGDRTARLEEIVWLPDGKNLLYISADKKYENNTLWRQPLDGGEPQQIADLGDEETSFLTLAPDGKSFAAVQGTWRHDAVLLKGLK